MINDWFNINLLEDETHADLGNLSVYVSIGLDEDGPPYFDITHWKQDGKRYLFGINGSADYLVARIAAKYFTPSRLNEIIDNNDEFLPAIIRRHRDEQTERAEFDKLRI